MQYEDMLMEYGSNFIIKEKPLRAYDGRTRGNKILIRKDMDFKNKSCILAEEIGHYYTTVGNILDQTKINNRKQELQARMWSYNKLIGLNGIVNAYKSGCKDLYEMADYLEVTESFLNDALDAYRNKYGTQIKHNGYEIVLDRKSVV